MGDKSIVKRTAQPGSLAARHKQTGALAKHKEQSGFACRERPHYGSSKLQVAFAFDTTGSMFQYFEKCKKAIHRIAQDVKENSNAETEFCIASYKNHGDEETYFDGIHPFSATQFTADIESLQRSLNKVENGGGGDDGLSALEDVLHHLTKEAPWDSNAHKVLVIIGDMPPHGVIDSISRCKYEYDYRAETEVLKAKGVKIYAVFCYEEYAMISDRLCKVKDFYSWIAKKTDGKYLELADIDEIATLLAAICVVENKGSMQDFRKTLSSRGLLTPSVDKKLKMLEGPNV